jgi:hypothetical protein
MDLSEIGPLAHPLLGFRKVSLLNLRLPEYSKNKRKRKEAAEQDARPPCTPTNGGACGKNLTE